jgi:cyclophilin family peptidyl-prolyl cis-trans isomerase
MADDPVVETNGRGMVSFATSGADSRTTQMFINFSDNANLDGMGFSPFAKVVEGMEVVDRIYKIGEKPDQGRIQAEGNRYLKREFPRLTYIESVEVLGGEKDDL